MQHFVKGSNTPSGCHNVLVNHSTETIATLDTNLALLGCQRHRRARRIRRREAERSVRPVSVVVSDEDGEDSLKVLVIHDQHPVETLRANGAYEALRHPIRLRGTNRRANDLAPRASKYLIETVGKLRVPVVELGNGTALRVRTGPMSLVEPVVSPIVRSAWAYIRRDAHAGSQVR